MKTLTPVHPNQRTTLALNGYYQPCGFFSARDAIHHLVTGAVKALDANYNPIPWNCPNGGLSWSEGNIDLPADSPSLRSASNEWAVPTIVVIPNYTIHKKKKRNRGISLRQIYNLYDKTCQYCMKEIPYSVATKDHVVPKSKGGSNFDSNLVLSCKKCNNKKASKFPFFNKNGSEVKPKVLSDLHFTLETDNIKTRPEWEQFIAA